MAHTLRNTGLCLDPVWGWKHTKTRSCGCSWFTLTPAGPLRRWHFTVDRFFCADSWESIKDNIDVFWGHISLTQRKKQCAFGDLLPWLPSAFCFTAACTWVWTVCERKGNYLSVHAVRSERRKSNTLCYFCKTESCFLKVLSQSKTRTASILQ